MGVMRQENYGGLYTRLTELSYERTLFTPALNVKLGYMAIRGPHGLVDQQVVAAATGVLNRLTCRPTARPCSPVRAQ